MRLGAVVQPTEAVIANNAESVSQAINRLVTGLFHDRDSAERAYQSIESRGYSSDDITVMISDDSRNNWFSSDDANTGLGSKAMEGTGMGSAIGAGTTLPGLGIIVAGPLTAALAGAGEGDLTGGLVGALVSSGIPEEHAAHYEEGIKNGGIVIGVTERSYEDADYFDDPHRRYQSVIIKNSSEAAAADEPLAARTATLTVESADVLAPLEIRDNVGRLIAAGRGHLVAAQLDPGFYRARLITPEGRSTEKLVDFSLPASIAAGELPPVELNQSVVLNAPAPSVSPIFDETIKRTNFRFDNYENLHVAEYVGAVATPQLTTILAITGSVVNELDGLEGNARNFGIQTFAQATGDATAGVRIIMADETMISDGASGYLSQVKVNLRRQDVADSVTEDGSFQSSTKIKGLSQYLQVAEPGAYFLSLTLPNSAAPTNFSLAVLPNRVTLLILHRRANNSIRILGFAPSSLPEPDFRSLEVKMRNLRQLDLLQRYYLSDRLDSEQTLEEAEDLLKDAGDLLYAKWIDPLAGCLGGYTLLKLDKADKIGEAAANMVRDYAELSDSHVLQAEFLKSQRRPAKKKIVDTYLAALDRGIPVFAEGLQRLAGAIDEYKIEHLLAARVLEIYQNRVRNSLWTIWT